MRRVLAWGLVLAWGAAPLLTAAAGSPPESHEGHLRILVNGQPVGSEEYRIDRTGTEIQAQAKTRLLLPDGEVEQEAELLLSADLSPRRYEWKIKEPKEAWIRMTFEGSAGTVTYPLPDGEQDKQVFDFATSRVALLDNNIFHHYLFLAGLYDFEQGGTQTIKVFVPQAVQPGEATVELLGVERATVAGRPQAVRKLGISTPDNRVLFWVTEPGRFVRLRVPSANVEVVADAAGP